MEETFIPERIYESMYDVFMYYFALSVTVVNGLSKPDCTNGSMWNVIIQDSVLSVTFVNKTLKPRRMSGSMWGVFM